MKRCRVPSRIAVAVSVATVAITALAASATHAVGFLTNPDADFATIASVIVFTIPGVLIGGQLGPALVGTIPEQRLIRGLGWLFLAIAAITLTEAVLG